MQVLYFQTEENNESVENTGLSDSDLLRLCAPILDRSVSPIKHTTVTNTDHILSMQQQQWSNAYKPNIQSMISKQSVYPPTPSPQQPPRQQLLPPTSQRGYPVEYKPETQTEYYTSYKPNFDPRFAISDSMLGRRSYTQTGLKNKLIIFNYVFRH